MDHAGRLSVGIVGFGRIGAEHAGWIAGAQQVHAVAASDPTPARRAIAEGRGIRTFETVEALIEHAEALENVRSHLTTAEVVKVIVVPDKLVNFVVRAA